MPMTSYADELEMQKWDSIYDDFQNYEFKLYSDFHQNPKDVISKIDSLLIVYKDDINIKADLHYFKAEVFYNFGNYKESIQELKFEDVTTPEIGLACNYIKMREFEKAKVILEQLTKSDDFNNFIIANYYETIGRKDLAQNLYENIKSDQTLKRFFYYQLVLDRISELKKDKFKLLESIYFPTGNPKFEED